MISQEKVFEGKCKIRLLFNSGREVWWKEAYREIYLTNNYILVFNKDTHSSNIIPNSASVIVGIQSLESNS